MENMNGLYSPLESLPFDYLSFGLFTAVNNVWTWVAVLTAAVSVWRYRASSSSSSPSPADAPISTKVEEAAGPSTKTAVAAVAVAPSYSACMFNSEGRTSGKFTVYYDRHNEKEEEEEVNGGVDGEEEGKYGKGAENEWLKKDGWEEMMKMRVGDHMGFYRYQDLTVLDGSVVRLWEGCRFRCRPVC